MRRCLFTALTAALALAAAVPFASGLVRAGHSGWEWGHPLPQGHTIQALRFQGSVGYAVGDFGTVLRSDDNGVSWSGLSTRVTHDLDLVSVIAADSVVVAGGCAVRRSDNGGTTFTRLPWTPTDEQCAAPVAALAFPSAQRGYLVLDSGAVIRTDDGGSTWTALPGTPVPMPTGVVFTSPDAGVVTSSAGAVYRTADAGVTWTQAAVAPHGLRAIDFFTPARGYAVGEGGTVLESLDSGKTWHAKAAPGAFTLTSIRCATALVCLATTDGGDRLLLTTDGGNSFKPVASTANIYTAAFAAGSHAVAAGAFGETIVSADSGTTWAPTGGRLAGTLTVLRATSPTLAFAAGRAGAVARTTDGGHTWRQLAGTGAEDLTDVSFTDAMRGYALDLFGRVLRTDDGGGSWHRVRVVFRARPQALLTLRGGGVLLIGPHEILRSSRRGAAFTRARGGAAKRAKLFEVDRGGRAIFAYGSRRIAASLNAGRSWNRVRRPRRALLAAVDFVSSNTGFLLEQDGRLWKTRNRGKTWHLLLGTGTDSAIGLSFSSGSRGYLVLSRFGTSSGGYVLRTSDGGRTWRPQLLTNVPLDPGGVDARGRTDYALASDGSIFFTTAGGDLGRRSTVSIATRRKRLRGRRTIRVAGKVSGAAPGSRVQVARRFSGDSGWDYQLATVSPSGRYATTWNLPRSSTFVAQWVGDDDQAGDGSPPMTVRVRRKLAP
jgi:photosystem II stability/assembly factor-like uncharacterized protein